MFGIGLNLGVGNLATVEAKGVDEIEGSSIVTGVVGNELDSTVEEFVRDNADEDYIIVCDFKDQEEWGSLAVNFAERSDAKKFQVLVENCKARLRLSREPIDGWHCYEAE